MWSKHLTITNSRSAVLATAALLLFSARARAEQIVFELDPSSSIIGMAADLIYYPMVPQGPDANATTYSGTITVNVNDPFAPTSIEFLGAAAAAANSGDWLPNDTVGPFPGYNEGDPDVNGDADPGAPAPANYGLVLDLRPIGIGLAYAAQRDMVWDITSAETAVSSGQFASLQTFALSGQQDYSVIPNPTNPDVEDNADQTFFDPAEDFWDNFTDSGSIDGTYAVDAEVATLTVPLHLFVVDGNAEVWYTGVLVGTADLTPPLLGDVNLDETVNGLDVDPFVQRVTSGTFQDEADMNQDGDVNGLDVDPFVAAVVGGSAVQGVPEPSTFVLAACGLVIGVWCTSKRRPGSA